MPQLNNGNKEEQPTSSIERCMKREKQFTVNGPQIRKRRQREKSISCNCCS